ncbi:MAG: type II toxin-antitoxin system RelE family toxin [Rhabdochlamydiaceae bacterium]
MEATRVRVDFLDQHVVDQLGSLPKTAQKMIKEAIKERLEIDPIGIGKPLQYSWKGHRRIRVSVYRVIYRVDNEKKLVTIIAIDYRKDVYK